MPKDFEETGVLDHVAKLSSAEDIFTYLLVPYEQEIVNVSRLHIMKRLGQYMREAEFAGMDDNAIFLELRAALKKAYLDFVESTPRKEKVFKVFRDEAEKHARRFVGIDTIGLANQ
ncbi:nitrogenase stabilizing/protective protein NifW [Mangrovicoccus ximenensis]|uniref:nitrogenase stabilizing/protective protein NifW n=1 Tax=Mangrovicoccus ximenensis TaxID=1911570 RepID=UPI000D357B58|nr:nitrogenase stabilizing/protective protein NifW [Mangrovicoccus ximenensis]